MERLYFRKEFWIPALISIIILSPVLYIMKVAFLATTLSMIYAGFLVIILPLLIISEVMKGTIVGQLKKDEIIHHFRKSQVILVISVLFFILCYIFSISELIDTGNVLNIYPIYLFLILYLLNADVIITQTHIYNQMLIIKRSNITNIKRINRNTVRITMKDNKRIRVNSYGIGEEDSINKFQ
ncbi:MAG: hypothetical protein PF505_02785 [Vallitaleaceae bacterium]|jgi:hypothetical protein|nr:hypothetical protein [Vallitaleaceae bacterium]